MMDGEEKAIVPVGDARLGALAVEPDQVISRATAIAKPLGQMILDRKLYTEIKGRKYVRVEGWTTLGAMLGVLPREVEVKKLEDGYEAQVELIRASDGLVIGRASAICLKSEKRWSTADEYAVRSMAITRATGKAFRLGFSWIIKLAGDYEPTPAEEMDIIEGEVRDAPQSPPEPKKVERPLPPEKLKVFMGKKVELYANAKANEKQTSLATGMLETCFAGNEKSDDLRHSVLAYLFGITSSKELWPSQVLALLDWLKPEKDSGGAYKPDPMAANEAQAVVGARMKELGQEEVL
jgi:hypothetical protein